MGAGAIDTFLGSGGTLGEVWGSGCYFSIE